MHIVTDYFSFRDLKFQQFMMDVFGGKAFWQRNEMQHRGISHTHGFMWLKYTENVQDLCNKATIGFGELLRKEDG